MEPSAATAVACDGNALPTGGTDGCCACAGTVAQQVPRVRASTNLVRELVKGGATFLKGHGFSRAVMSLESWALAPEGRRTSTQHRSSSVAKAAMDDSNYGTAEAVPLQGR